MNEEEFVIEMSKKAQQHKKSNTISKNQRLYFIITLITFSKTKNKHNHKYNDEYYEQTSEPIIILTNSLKKLFRYIKQNFKKTQISLNNHPKIPNPYISIGILEEEIDFSKIQTIQQTLTTEPPNRQKIILECLQKQLKLKPQDKIKIIQTTNEGYTVGKHESASGEAIITGKTYTYFWLEHNNKKGYYLDYIKPIKIIDLDKTE